MKKYIFILFWVLLYQGVAQQNPINCVSTQNNAPCCNGQIITDPTMPFNPDRDYLNLFNWRNPNMRAYFPNGGQWNSPTPVDFLNPFFTDAYDPFLRHINFYNYPSYVPRTPDLLDFHPQNGWELMHRNLGFAQDEITPLSNLQNGDRRAPYFILYNRYTGKLRYIGSLGLGDTNPQQIVTSLKFRKNSMQTTETVSGLLGLYGAGGLAQPLDKTTNVLEISQAAQGVATRQFFTADFDMAYDPCACNSTIDMEFTFKTLSTANILLEGRIIGTNVPLNSSGQSPLINRDDFLTAVYNDDFDVKGGLQTYHNIDKLVDKYKVPAMSPTEKVAMNVLKSIFKEGLKSVFGPVDNILGGVASLLTSSLKGEKILGYTIKAEDTKIKGFGIAGALSSAITSAVFPEKPPTPNISFLEAEGVFSGKMNTETLLSAGNIILAHPGSKESTNPNVPWQNYPFYNEALGLFAMIKTPKVAYSHSAVLHPYTGQPVATSMHAAFQKFEFAFNPSAEVDVDKTKIFGALLVDMGYINSQGKRVNVKPDEVKNAGLLPDDNQATYITPFVPIEYLNQIQVKLQKNNFFASTNFAPEFKLRLMIEYTFKPNRYGVVNKSLQVLTYALDALPLVHIPVQGAYYVVPDTNHPDYVNLALQGNFKDLSIYQDEANYFGNPIPIINVHLPENNYAWNRNILKGTYRSGLNRKLNFYANETEVAFDSNFQTTTLISEGTDG